MWYRQQLVDVNLISKMKFSQIFFSFATAKEFSQFYRNTITEPEPLGSRNEIFFNDASREPRSVFMSKIKNRMYRRELQGNAHYNLRQISKKDRPTSDSTACQFSILDLVKLLIFIFSNGRQHCWRSWFSLSSTWNH